MMLNIAVFYSCLATGFGSYFLWKPDCRQLGLQSCVITSNCTDNLEVVSRRDTPTPPGWGPSKVGIAQDHHVDVPILNVTLILSSDASILEVRGTRLRVVDRQTNGSLCLQLSYRLHRQLNDSNHWTFSFPGLVVEAAHTYLMSAFHLPLPDVGEYAVTTQVTIPGCGHHIIRNSQMCLENGSLWDPRITTGLSMARNQILSVVVAFEADRHSSIYQVSVQNHRLHLSENVSKEKTTSLNVTFCLDMSQLLKCELLITIKPFFTQCMKEGCRPEHMSVDYCSHFPTRSPMIKGAVVLIFVAVCFTLLWTASHKADPSLPPPTTDPPPQHFQVRERKKVLILYSLDHPLYKNIILKFAAFLKAQCGTEVILDLLDSANLATLGTVQWLEWQRERMENSSDQILLLCSKGVQAKWRAMCGGQGGPVLLREDLLSPWGDTLTPALGLVVPGLLRRASFNKYAVAYFDGIGSPEDVPRPFNVTLRYNLMGQFEELFFRILDAEKQGPGRLRRIPGLAEGDYHLFPAGRALMEACERFREYQRKNPRWFEEQLVEDFDINC
ncbi:interleukin-17 receptor A [Stigmatopora nigra]